MDPNRLVNLEIFENRRDMLVIASKLEACGLFVWHSTPWPSPFVPFQLGGIALKVRAADYMVAKAIMEDAEQDAPRVLSPWAKERSTLIVYGVTLAVFAWLFWKGGGTIGRLEPSDPFGLLFGAAFAWAIALAEAIRLHGRWWLLVTAPIVLLPVAQFFTLGS